MRGRARRGETSVIAGTIFADTKLPLQPWFQAIWLLTNQKHGTSALDLQRAIGFSYETAWTMLHKLRRAMVREERELLDGVIEVDETYVGGPVPGKRGRGAVHRVASLLKRWLLGTHQDGVSARQIDFYLDEFVFRFNRRRSGNRGLVFHRLLEQAVVTEPTLRVDIIRGNP